MCTRFIYFKGRKLWILWFISQTAFDGQGWSRTQPGLMWLAGPKCCTTFCSLSRHTSRRLPLGGRAAGAHITVLRSCRHTGASSMGSHGGGVPWRLRRVLPTLPAPSRLDEPRGEASLLRRTQSGSNPEACHGYVCSLNCFLGGLGSAPGWVAADGTILRGPSCP